MKAILLYRNPDCAKCARYARMHHRFDWLNRFEDTTEVPATGALRLGEIAAKDLATGKTLKGVACLRLLCRNIPAYWALLPLLYLPTVQRSVEREIGGCDGESCALPRTESVAAQNAQEAER